MRRNVEPMYGQRFLQPFLQTSRCARIQVHQFALQLGQRQFGGGMLFHCVSRIQFFGHRRLLFIGQMIEHIAPLMNLTALDRCRLASVFEYRCTERLAAIQKIQSWLSEIQPAIGQVALQLAHHRCILGGALPDTQDRFAPILADSQCGYHLLAGERRRVNQQGA